MKKRAILFWAWGAKYIQAVKNCIEESCLPEADIILLTSEDDEIGSLSDKVKRVNTACGGHGKLLKSNMADYLPSGYHSFLFLDSDIRVLSDITFGFEKAEQYGIAAAQAAHYSLDHFHGFERIMRQEKMNLCNQLQYNTGVLFFATSPPVLEVFSKWKGFCEKYKDEEFSDQPFFTLALEQLGFNPYTLSTSYNQRGFGEQISGTVRIWHSFNPVPKGINDFEKPWPRRYCNGEVIETF